MRIDGANSGGITSRLGGLALFVPVSQLEKKDGGKWWSAEVRLAAPPPSSCPLFEG